jgi:hypothetical protein
MIEALQQGAKRGAHYPSADQQDIYFIFGHLGITGTQKDLLRKREMDLAD